MKAPWLVTSGDYNETPHMDFRPGFGRKSFGKIFSVPQRPPGHRL